MTTCTSACDEMHTFDPPCERHIPDPPTGEQGVPYLPNPEPLDNLPTRDDYETKLFTVLGPEPLSAEEQRYMFEAVLETRTQLLELRAIMADLPGKLPELFDALPPMLKMMLGVK